MHRLPIFKYNEKPAATTIDPGHHHYAFCAGLGSSFLAPSRSLSECGRPCSSATDLMRIKDSAHLSVLVCLLLIHPSWEDAMADAANKTPAKPTGKGAALVQSERRQRQRA